MGRHFGIKLKRLFLAAQITAFACLALVLFACILGGLARGATPDYSTAEQKAQEAFLVQTGIQKDLTDTGKAIHGIAAQYVPANVFDPILACGMVVYKRRISTKEFTSPLFPFLKHTLTVTPDHGTFVTLWHF